MVFSSIHTKLALAQSAILFIFPSSDTNQKGKCSYTDLIFSFKAIMLIQS